MYKSNENSGLQREGLELLRFREGLAEEAATYFPDASGFVLGLSGGLDSTTLLHIFCASALFPKLRALHVNYHLRGEESDDDEKFCAKLCSQLGVPLEIISVKEPAPSTGIQDWARSVRSRAFKRWQRDGHVVVLAHHANDLAETMIFRLARGASCGNLLGMKSCEPGLWRPMLHLRREKIAHWAKQNRWDHREDSSNAKIEYSRNFIRHEVLPRLETLFPGAGQRLIRLGIEAQELERFCLDSLATRFGSSPTSLAAKDLCDMDVGVAFQALRLMLRSLGEEDACSKVNRQLWQQIYERVKSSQDKAICWCFDLPGGLLFKFDHGVISVIKERQAQKANRASQHRMGLQSEWQDLLIGPGGEATVTFEHTPQKATTLQNLSELTKLLRASNQNG